MKAIKHLAALLAASFVAFIATASDQPLVLTADQDDLSDMSLGCESDCSVMGTVGGVLVWANKDDQGTTLKFLGGKLLDSELTPPSLDAEFLEAADTGSCLVDCRAVLKMGEWWAFIHKDHQGKGTVRVSNVPHPPMAAAWQDYWYLYSDEHCTAFIAGYETNSVGDPCPACKSIGPKGPVVSVMAVAVQNGTAGNCYVCNDHCSTGE